MKNELASLSTEKEGERCFLIRNKGMSSDIL